MNGSRLTSPATLSTMRNLSTVAASASATSGPELPRLSTPVVDILGAVEVGVHVARSLSTAASVPVVIIDLPETHIVASAVSVLVDGVGVSSALVLHNAFAVRLVPGVLRAPGSDINVVRRTSTRA